jgi:pyruvate/2-oxoglutarate dehydrogenase complex dihydrolipoamide acyltransferase (E2) component
MNFQLSVPAAVPGVEEVRILEWYGGPGDRFDIGELIVELETHKAVVEVRAGQSGILRDVRARAGDWVQVETILAIFSDQPDEPISAAADGISELLVGFEVT